MLKEVNANDAANAFVQGLTGYVIRNGELFTFREAIDAIATECRLLVDFPDPEENGNAHVQEEPEMDNEAPKSMPVQETKHTRHRRSREEIEQLVLQAWRGGDRSITQIMDITGCTYATVRRYIPVTPEG